MVRRAQKHSSRPESTFVTLKPIDNSDTKMPASVKKAVRARQKKLIDDEKAIRKLDEARAATPKELEAREKILTRIAKKIGIADELEQLAELEKKRELRCQEALDELRSRSSEGRKVK